MLVSIANAVVVSGVVYFINNKNKCLKNDRDFFIKLACVVGVSSYFIFEVIKDNIDKSSPVLDLGKAKLHTNVDDLFGDKSDDKTIRDDIKEISI